MTINPPVTLTDRELATILDALRYWQQARIDDSSFVHCDDYFTDCTPLAVSMYDQDEDEVDALCEKLNTADIWADTPEADDERDRLLAEAADKYPDLEGTELSDRMQADERARRGMEE